MTVKEKISRLKAVRLDRLFDAVVKAHKKELIQMNRDQMYEEGILDIGTGAGQQQYAESSLYAKRKYARYKKDDFITLKQMGDFHKAIDIKILPDEIVFYSDDEKWVNWLSPQDRFKRALGLTDDNLDKLREIVKEGVLKKLKDVI